MDFTLNGQRFSIDDAHSDTPLLYILRNDFQLNGPKFGCGIGECGACTINIDGVAARSCSVPVHTVAGRQVTTLEGLAEDDGLHPVQQGFIDEQAAQCGYCTNGMIMTLVALFRRNPQASEQQIKNELAFNLCRCGT
ncbi:(2Fe-2S)-binding protein, partial [Erwinia sp. MYb416]